MPITLSEQFESAFVETGDVESIENRYEATGSDDRLAVRDYAKAELPTEYDGLPRRQISIEPFGRSDQWRVTVRYASTFTSGSEIVNQTGDVVRTFDTGGGTEHVEFAISTPHSYAVGGGTPPAQNDAINVTKDGVSGVDIQVPGFQFSITRFVEDEDFTAAYKKAIASLTKRVNNAAFEDFDAGEVLFVGASGYYRPNFDDWEITFNFAQNDNRNDIAIGGITDINKDGWEYLWVLYEDAVDSDVIVKQVKAVYVNEVYRQGDFAVLGIT